MKVLVGIAHHGHKNRPFLQRMLAEFRAMDHAVDVVVLAEAPKDLGPDVEVRVGLPTANPWSLPFAHREVFAERRDAYDVFVYAEDDTLITQRTLDTFAELSATLPDHLVPGFMRFEEHPDGARSYCSVHSYYRWFPESVFRHAGLTFARFSNEHAAAYALTQDQLHRAIASGGFLVPPHEGTYDMLVSAATDPYTRCGLQKVVCIDRIDDLLLHHLPNVYLGRLGIDQAAFDAQLDALRAIADGTRPSVQLLRPEVPTSPPVWSKHAFPADEPVDDLLPSRRIRRVLCVGTVAGGIERDLLDRDIEVVAVPVDGVLGAVAGLHGATVLEPDALRTGAVEAHGPYDAIAAIDVVPYARDPVGFLTELAAHLAPGGTLVVTAPDHGRYAVRNRLWPSRRTPLPASWAEHGSQVVTPRSLRRWVRAAGFRKVRLHHRRAERRRPLGVADLRGRLTGNSLAAVAVRPAGPPGVPGRS